MLVRKFTTKKSVLHLTEEFGHDATTLSRIFHTFLDQLLYRHGNKVTDNLIFLVQDYLNIIKNFSINSKLNMMKLKLFPMNP